MQVKLWCVFYVGGGGGGGGRGETNEVMHTCMSSTIYTVAVLKD